MNGLVMLLVLFGFPGVATATQDDASSCDFEVRGQPKRARIQGPDNIVSRVRLVEQSDSPTEVLAINFEESYLSLGGDRFEWEDGYTVTVRNWRPGSPHVLYAPKSAHDDPNELFPRLEKIDALEFLARVITQIPQPRRHLLFYYGHYANVVRGLRKISQPSEQVVSSPNERQQDETTLSPAPKQALRRRWADLIRRVFELDPLLCPCGGTLRVVAFITEPRVIRTILDHLKDKANGDRAPPPDTST